MKEEGNGENIMAKAKHRGFCFITFFAMVKYKEILVQREKVGI